MLYKIYRISFPLGLLFLVSACQSWLTKPAWPTDLPPRQVFVEAFLENRNLEQAEPAVLESHLSWIQRFYQGTLLYPNGWNQATEQFLATITDTRIKQEVEQRMYALGIEIANEWAQDNHQRNIDNTNVAIWGSALREAAERNDHLAFISKVEKDVAKLIAREISAGEIDYERYYPDEDYGNF
ncbi:hypothetical protein GCM10008090_27020 [Arenicella chitinivorans]|uniref:Uncharacterized protein n=1 Tax=Arenicella chitinivorans TaxID=1329800 RepID=A0A918RYS3_9GAMM|nr:hypothetical protein [Arenicella chitinivorans]GHA15921.1 hypothetical protein GCM10008090_27020 [Arenicella chitinivorans]